MPEGDVVHRTCARLHEALAGRTLLAAELRWPGLSTADLAGATVTEVVPRGKHILIRLDTGWTLHSHLRMEGQWRIERTVDPPSRPLRSRRELANGGVTPRPLRSRRELANGGVTKGAGNPDVRAILVAEPWTALGLRLGRLDLVRTADERSVVGHLGPDILATDFDATTAAANLTHTGGPIGAALLDQRNLAGIGTVWASESLFAERLNPWAEVLSDDELRRLVERARRMMLASLAGHGEPRVHGRSGRPCRRCGNTVRVAQIGPPTRERAMFYCPTCQGGLAPNDDGRPIAPLGARRRT
ncbi:MAG: Fpg/Nei family DNA glycosylase [Propionibacteriaceae bacterium]|nr:Fpg/Nei family DNA glycosylase [Propionibacteriaceae bacterium]